MRDPHPREGVNLRTIRMTESLLYPELRRLAAMRSVFFPSALLRNRAILRRTRISAPGKVLSGSRHALRHSGPLRTVHAPFNAHGSSLSKPPLGSRFRYC
jgi:hypothetical protein